MMALRYIIKMGPLLCHCQAPEHLKLPSQPFIRTIQIISLLQKPIAPVLCTLY